jgi:hypothetical protein
MNVYRKCKHEVEFDDHIHCYLPNALVVETDAFFIYNIMIIRNLI